MILVEVPGDQIDLLVSFVAETRTSMLWPAAFTVGPDGVSEITINGAPVDPNRTYVLSVSDYLANGGNGFAMLKTLKRLDVEPMRLREMILKEIQERTAQGDSISAVLPQLVREIK